MQGSTEFNGSAAPVDLTTSNEILDEARASKAIGVYRALNLRKFFRASGNPVKPVDGFYYAETDEDASALDHFHKAGKVQKVEQII
jgi:hypothetical protein